MHTGRTLSLVVTTCLACFSCSGGGGGGSTSNSTPTTPTTPQAASPTISQLQPASALAGTRVTVVGANFGTSAASVSVTFRGVAATLVSVADAAIVATVPALSIGDAPVTVTVYGKTSNSGTFTVLQPAPVVTSISPTTPRAGDTLVIRGSNFTVATAALSRNTAFNLNDTATPQVLIDAKVVQVSSFTSNQIGVALGIDLPVGNHSLVVSAGGVNSAQSTFTSQIFNATGSWSGPVQITANTCGAGAPVGTTVGVPFSVGDQIPILGALFNGQKLNGTITPAGRATATGTTGSVTTFLDVGLTVFITPQIVAADGTVRLNLGVCEVDGKITSAQRWSTVQQPLIHVSIDNRTVVTGGAVNPGLYLYYVRDPISDQPIGQIQTELVGAWQSRTTPIPHIGTAAGFLRVFWNTATNLDGTPMMLDHKSFLPLSSDQAMTMLAFDAAGNTISTQTIQPIDNTPVLFTGATLFALPTIDIDRRTVRTEIHPAGTGFTTVVGWFGCREGVVVTDPKAFAYC